MFRMDFLTILLKVNQKLEKTPGSICSKNKGSTQVKILNFHKEPPELDGLTSKLYWMFKQEFQFFTRLSQKDSESKH